MPKESGYNGWGNYQTWRVALALGNEERYADLRKQAESAAAEELGEALKARFIAESPLAGRPGLYADLLDEALCAVDWQEIAERLRDDVED